MTKELSRTQKAPKPVQIALGLGIMAALAGCEVRQNGEEQPDPVASETAAAVSVPDDSETAAASIIREDAGGGPIITAPEPLKVTVPFAENGADLSPQAEQVLAGVLKSAQIEQDWPIILGGHTDSTGNDQANLRASRSRAEAVAAWLVERGVADGRIKVIGFGEQNPAAPNALPDGSPNEAGRMRNRRVDITIAPPPPAPAKDPAIDPANAVPSNPKPRVGQ